MKLFKSCFAIVALAFATSVANAGLDTETYVSIDGSGSGATEGDLSGVGSLTLLDADGGDVVARDASAHLVSLVELECARTSRRVLRQTAGSNDGVVLTVAIEIQRSNRVLAQYLVSHDASEEV